MGASASSRAEQPAKRATVARKAIRNITAGKRHHKQPSAARASAVGLAIKNITNVSTAEGGPSVYRGGLEGELQRVRNQLATLLADFSTAQRERSAADEMRSSIAQSFSVSTRRTSHSSTFVIQAPRFGSFCTARVASIFAIDLLPNRSYRLGVGRKNALRNVSEVELKASRSFVAGCPGQAAGGAIEFAAPLPRGDLTRACVSLELFNVNMDDLARSGVPFNATAGKSEVLTKKKGGGCTRFSVHVGRRLGCMDLQPRSEDRVTSAGRETTGEQEIPLCDFKGETRGAFTNPGDLLSVGRSRITFRPSCRLSSKRPPSGQWVHFLGDSVTDSMISSYCNAVLGHRCGLSYSKSRLGRSYGFRCEATNGSSTPSCISFGEFMDPPGVKTPFTKDCIDTGCVSPELLQGVRKKAADVAAPDTIVLTFGSHHGDVWGFDEHAKRRYRYALDMFVDSLLHHNTSKLVLALEPAREVSVTPGRFAHPSMQCMLSNWRRQHRNILMADVLKQVCDARAAAGMQCRVLDLFSPTIALTGAEPGLFYKQRDPIHVLRPRPEQFAFLIRMVRDVLGSFNY